jgi:hypothetical protein
MRKIALAIVLCIVVGGHGLAQAQSVKKVPRIAIFQVEDQTMALKPRVLRQLTNYLSSQIAEGGNFLVVPGSKIRERLLAKKKASYKACVDEKCQIEIGRELAANKSLSTQILKLGSKCVVIATLYDLRAAATERSTSQKGGCGADALVTSLEKTVAKLKGNAATAKADEPGRAKVKVEVKRGGLLIKSRPSGAQVWLDDKKQKGKTPLTLRDLAAGAHSVELQRGDYLYRGQLRVLADQFSTIALALRKVRGKLEVVSTPPEADVWLDDKFVGKTPMILKRVEPGVHNVELRKTGFASSKQSVEFGIKVTKQTVNLTLVEAGRLSVASQPPGAVVYIDGKKSGETPVTLSLAPKKYNVKLVMDNREPQVKEAAVVAGKTAKVAMSMEWSVAEKKRMAASQSQKQAEITAQRQKEASYLAALADHESKVALTRKARKSKSMRAYIALGVGIAAAGAGGALLAVGKLNGDSAYDKYKAVSSFDQVTLDAQRDEMSSAKTLMIVGGAALGVGVGVLAYSIYEFVSRPQLETPPDKASFISSFGLVPTDGGLNVSMSARF